MSRRPWGHLRRILPVNTHPDRHWRILDTFDWYSPRYQDKDCSPARVLGVVSRGRHPRRAACSTSRPRFADAGTSRRRCRWSDGRFPTCGGSASSFSAPARPVVRRFELLQSHRAWLAVVGVVDNDPGKARPAHRRPRRDRASLRCRVKPTTWSSSRRCPAVTRSARSSRPPGLVGRPRLRGHRSSRTVVQLPRLRSAARQPRRLDRCAASAESSDSPMQPPCAGWRARWCIAGPDDEAFYEDDEAVLGFRRLSIIDVAGGRQPLSNEDGSIRVVFNGEIYNHRELRDDLERRGHVLAHAAATAKSSRTSTRRLGDDSRRPPERHLRVRDLGSRGAGTWCSRAIRTASSRSTTRERAGGLALRVGDQGAGRQRPRLARARSRSGRPVPAVSGRAAALRHRPRRPRARAGSRAREERRTGEGAHLLDAAAERPGAITSPEEATHAVREGLETRCKRAADAERPLGVFLSGGVDSSAIVALAAARRAAPLKTFSVGFFGPDEEVLTEWPWARLVAERYDTDHHEFVLTEEMFREALPHTLRAMDQPTSDGINSYWVSYAAAQHVTVALSGTGGDELFLGYGRDAQPARGPRPGHAAAPSARGLPARGRRACSDRVPDASCGSRSRAQAEPPSGWPGSTGRSSRRAASASSNTPSAMPHAGAAASGAARHVPARRSTTCAATCRRTSPTRPTGSRASSSAPTSRSSCCATSMRCRWRTRSKCACRSSIRGSATSPRASARSMKLRDGVGKWVLKHALRDLLPDEILFRPKMGFGLPYQRLDAAQARADRSRYAGPGADPPARRLRSGGDRGLMDRFYAATTTSGARCGRCSCSRAGRRGARCDDGGHHVAA